MPTDQLDALLRPNCVAVIGASADPRKVSGMVLSRLLSGFKGSVLAVNPGQREVQGVPALKSLSEAREQVDLVVVVVKPEGVVAALEDAGAAGAKAAIVVTSGLGEGRSGIDAASRELIDGLRARYGIRVLGPNCLGLLNMNIGLAATFADFSNIPLHPGRVAIISQSGAVGTSTFRQCQSEGFPVSCVVTTGNELDLTAWEVAEYVLKMDDIDVVLMFLEGIRKPEWLFRAGEVAARLGKTILALKVGVSTRASLAAQSHTGALQASDKGVDAVFAKAGIHRVMSIRELIEYGKVLSFAKPLKGRRVAVVTGSGGLGVMLADEAMKVNLELPELSAELQARLAKLVPPYAALGNPVDYTGQSVADSSNLGAILDVLLDCGEVDAVCVGGIGRPLYATWYPILKARATNSQIPFVVYSDHRLAELAEARIPVVSTPALAMGALRLLVDVGIARGVHVCNEVTTPALLPDKPVVKHDTSLSESDSRNLLRRYGMEFVESTQAYSADMAIEQASRLGFPVVLKLNSSAMPHKTEHGAVKLMLCDKEAVRKAYDDLARIAHSIPLVSKNYSITVQPNVRADIELLLGAYRDPTFGALISLGLGGQLVEIISQTSTCCTPVSRNDAQRLLSELCNGRLLKSARGLSTGAAEQVLKHVLVLGDLMEKEEWIVEVDINPLMVNKDKVFAVDALVVGVHEITGANMKVSQ